MKFIRLFNFLHYLKILKYLLLKKLQRNLFLLNVLFLFSLKYAYLIFI